MPETAITIENLGKRYIIGHQRAKGDGMRHAIESAMRAPVAWLRSRRERKLQLVDFWALKEVCLEIKQGEVIGVIGVGGARGSNKDEQYAKAGLAKIQARLK